MASPAKKLDFASSEPMKAKPLVGLPPLLSKPVVEAAKGTDSAVVKAEHDDEPLLRENPNRFVLFPLKYHEVSGPTRQIRVN